MTRGEWTLTPVFDGFLDTAHEAVTNLDPEAVATLTGVPAGRPIPISVRGFLLRDGERTAIIDTGAGPGGAPALGGFLAALGEQGVEPSQVDHVLLTHIHSDHSNGLVDVDGRPAFPRAELILHGREAAFWLGEVPAGASDRIARNFRNAARTVGPYRDRMCVVEDGGGLTGISALLAAGHTPGHCGWMIETGDGPTLVWGDIVHFTRVQVPVPDATLVYDVDPEAAVASRRRVFDMVASENLRIAGAHLEGSGFGHIERAGRDYRLIHDDPAHP